MTDGHAVHTALTMALRGHFSCAEKAAPCPWRDGRVGQDCRNPVVRVPGEGGGA